MGFLWRHGLVFKTEVKGRTKNPVTIFSTLFQSCRTFTMKLPAFFSTHWSKSCNSRRGNITDLLPAGSITCCSNSTAGRTALAMGKVWRYQSACSVRSLATAGDLPFYHTGKTSEYISTLQGKFCRFQEERLYDWIYGQSVHKYKHSCKLKMKFLPVVSGKPMLIRIFPLFLLFF